MRPSAPKAGITTANVRLESRNRLWK
jgi:hypothetical protein